MINILLLLVALVLFVLSGVGVNGGKLNLVALGLAFVTLYFLMGAGIAR